MTVYFAIWFFIFGLVFGSFFNVVGYRLPKKESFVMPWSHCMVCNHRLGFLETIPVFSYFLQGGKCKHCHTKIPFYHTVFELLTGFLFLLSYLRFGFSSTCLLSILLSSLFIIIIISDYKYFLIPDECIIVGVILISVCMFLIGGGSWNHFSFLDGLKNMGISLLNGLGSFILMYLVKKIGDFIFKKESMGGGDIKLMFLIGMVLGFPLAMISIFVASLIGLPIAIFLLTKKSSHVIAFGPLLSVAALILFFAGCSWMDILMALV